jgi:hypothetical protein
MIVSNTQHELPAKTSTPNPHVSPDSRSGRYAVNDHHNNTSTLEREVKGRLEREVENMRRELREERENFEAERANWLEEKEKVIKYQKQLQLNYVQMFRRTRALEEELAREKGEVGRQRTSSSSTTPSPAPRSNKQGLVAETHC